MRRLGIFSVGMVCAMTGVAQAQTETRPIVTATMQPGSSTLTFDATGHAGRDVITLTSSADFKTLTFSDPGAQIVGDVLNCPIKRGTVTCTGGAWFYVKVLAGAGNDDVVVKFPAGMEHHRGPQITVDGGVGNDWARVSGGGITTVLMGGLGNDVLRLGRDWGGADGGEGTDEVYGSPEDDGLGGGGGKDVVYGGDGPDVLWGGLGDDLVFGGAGDDKFIDEGGADLMQGEDGRDTADYGQTVTAVNVSLDGVANDGPAGEGDNALVENIEAVRGNSSATVQVPGNDVLTGDAGGNTLRSSGNPIIHGGGGNDALWALWTTTARLFGDDGDDSLQLTQVADATLDGAAGNDHFQSYYAGGAAEMIGGIGDDHFEARDQDALDTVRCGDGADKVRRDPGDVAEDCETEL
jgi:Ca2+-binding RTX toxin-like protein